MTDNDPNKKAWPLPRLLAAGTFATAFVTFWLLCFFARLIDGPNSSWFKIASHNLNSGQWYDVVRSTIGAVGVLGVAAAGLIAYRRQKTTEATYQVELERQESSAKMYRLELERQETSAKMYRLELERHHNSSIVNLRNRFTTASEQLGHNSPAVRMAGAYAMAALADDWHTAKDDTQKQVCIDVLCAYLRIPYTTSENIEGHGEQHVRWAIITIITNHLQDPDARDTWCGNDFDFTRATFDGGNFFDAKFIGGTVNFGGAKFIGGAVDFGAEFNGGTVNFNAAEFNGGTVNFLDAKFNRGTVNFLDAKFNRGTVNFRGAKFNRGAVDFSLAEFNGGTVNFRGAEFNGGTVNFSSPQRWETAPLFDWKNGDTVPHGVEPTAWPPIAIGILE